MSKKYFQISHCKNSATKVTVRMIGDVFLVILYIQNMSVEVPKV